MNGEGRRSVLGPVESWKVDLGKGIDRPGNEELVGMVLSRPPDEWPNQERLRRISGRSQRFSENKGGVEAGKRFWMTVSGFEAVSGAVLGAILPRTDFYL